MPEGHTIHRLARDHTKLLVGAGPVAVSSPQGRFAADAALVDGVELQRIEAYGKHLFHWWANGRVGHVSAPSSPGTNKGSVGTLHAKGTAVDGQVRVGALTATRTDIGTRSSAQLSPRRASALPRECSRTWDRRTRPRHGSFLARL
jgi:hypothetical protein